LQRFNEKNPLESVVLTFNFVLFLPPGVLLTGTPVVTITDPYGNDTDPAAIANGPPAIDESQTLVLMPVTGGLDMNDYIVVAQCPTTSLSWTPALPAILPIRSFPSRVGAP
jgi:hypothetical protein